MGLPPQSVFATIDPFNLKPLAGPNAIPPSNLGGNVFTLGAPSLGGAHGTLGQPAGAAGQRVEYRKL